MADARQIKKLIYGEDLRKESHVFEDDKFALPEMDLTKVAHVKPKYQIPKLEKEYPETAKEFQRLQFEQYLLLDLNLQ